MGIGCPQIVYPYLRANVAVLITRAGFPPVQLAEINFQAMYEQQQAQLGQQDQTTQPSPLAAA
jgi:preprotein translocase subunit SecB